jgi:hypothetical protein
VEEGSWCRRPSGASGNWAAWWQKRLVAGRREGRPAPSGVLRLACRQEDGSASGSVLRPSRWVGERQREGAVGGSGVRAQAQVGQWGYVRVCVCGPGKVRCVDKLPYL